MSGERIVKDIKHKTLNLYSTGKQVSLSSDKVKEPAEIVLLILDCRLHSLNVLIFIQKSPDDRSPETKT